MVKSILDGSRHQRQQRRRAAGTLRYLQLQPATVKRYRTAVNFFFSTGWKRTVKSYPTPPQALMTCSPNSLRIAGFKGKRDLSSAMYFQVCNIFVLNYVVGCRTLGGFLALGPRMRCRRGLALYCQNKFWPWQDLRSSMAMLPWPQRCWCRSMACCGPSK